jgi:hypothetical protein
VFEDGLVPSDLEVGRGEQAKGGVANPAIVKDLQVFEYGAGQLDRVGHRHRLCQGTGASLYGALSAGTR